MAVTDTDTAGSVPSLVYWGQESLMIRQPSVAPSAMDDPSWQQHLDGLARAMEHHGGIGIAAPQIGWSARVFCFGIRDANPRYPEADAMPLQFWVNPRILTSGGNCWAWEGCLSVPGLRGWVARPADIEVAGLNEHGDAVTSRFSGWPARVFQHEMDHLDGVLMPMRISEPRFLLSDALMAQRSLWQENWPAPGAFATQPGGLSPER